MIRLKSVKIHQRVTRGTKVAVANSTKKGTTTKRVGVKKKSETPIEQSLAASGLNIRTDENGHVEVYSNMPNDGSPFIPSGDIHEVAINDLHDDKWNTRYSVGQEEFELHKYENSLLAYGFFKTKPIEYYINDDNKKIILDGHERIAACRKILRTQPGTNFTGITPGCVWGVMVDKPQSLFEAYLQRISRNTATETHILDHCKVVREILSRNERMYDASGNELLSVAQKRDRIAELIGMSRDYLHKALKCFNAMSTEVCRLIHASDAYSNYMGSDKSDTKQPLTLKMTSVINLFMSSASEYGDKDFRHVSKWLHKFVTNKIESGDSGILTYKSLRAEFMEWADSHPVLSQYNIDNLNSDSIDKKKSKKKLENQEPKNEKLEEPEKEDSVTDGFNNGVVRAEPSPDEQSILASPVTTPIVNDPYDVVKRAETKTKDEIFDLAKKFAHKIRMGDTDEFLDVLIESLDYLDDVIAKYEDSLEVESDF